MARVPGGEYEVGVRGAPLPAAGVALHVAKVAAFDLDVLEVSVSDYARCVESGGCATPAFEGADCNWGVAGRERHPINCISFEQGAGYCQWEGKRLPTEDEWAVAARLDGVPRVLAEAGDHACARGESGQSSGPDGKVARGTCVGGTDAMPSRLGLHDMSGNVSELTDGRLCAGAHAMCRRRVVRGTAWWGHLYEEPIHRWVAPEVGGIRMRESERQPSTVGVRCAK